MCRLLRSLWRRHMQVGEALFALGTILLILFLLGIVGKWDYEDARMLECAQADKSYNVEKDLCE